MQSIQVNAYQYLMLTLSNKESLVFYSPELNNNAPVLFTADSDLVGAQVPFIGVQNPPIVTSPHHGSEANANAYTTVTSWFKHLDSPPLWIRSDSKSRTRPGNSYLRQANRICTLCNDGKDAKQFIEIDTHNSQWVKTAKTRACSCK